MEQYKPRDVGAKRAREDSEEFGRTARARTIDEVPAEYRPAENQRHAINQEDVECPVTLPSVRKQVDSSQDTAECAAQSMVPPPAKPTAMEIEIYVAALASSSNPQPPSGDVAQMQILPSEIGRPKAASEMTHQSRFCSRFSKDASIPLQAAGSVSSTSPPATPPSSSQKNAATAKRGTDSSRAGAAAAAAEGCGPEAKVTPQLSHFMSSLGISAKLTGMRSQIGRLIWARVPLRPLEKRAGLSQFPQLWCV